GAPTSPAWPRDDWPSTSTRRDRFWIIDPFPLAGKGQGLGVSAPGLPISRRRQPRTPALAPPPPTPPRKGEGSLGGVALTPSTNDAPSDKTRGPCNRYLQVAPPPRTHPVPAAILTDAFFASFDSSLGGLDVAETLPPACYTDAA